jgi:hypothetical protein
MNADDVKKALLVASRAYERASRARTCGEAANNIRIGQRWELRAREAMRELIPAKTPPRNWSPVQRELNKLDSLLPHAAFGAHLHRLDRCGISQLQHEWQAARERSTVDVDKAIDRYDRKRSKRRSRR